LGGSNFELDLAAVRAVRRRVQNSVRLMVDFNQALTFSDAMQYTLALDDEGIYWIEEPIRHDDYRHMAQIAQVARTPIQIGENFTGLAPMAAVLEAGSSDYVMLDLDRIGGVSGWQRASGLASAYNREVSSRLFPEVSAHCWQQRRDAIGSNMSTGPIRSCRSRSVSRMAWQCLPAVQATALLGTAMSLRNTGLPDRWEGGA
jgi:hypothetical protein